MMGIILIVTPAKCVNQVVKHVYHFQNAYLAQKANFYKTINAYLVQCKSIIVSPV